MSHPEQETLMDLAAAYALGALPAEEAQRFEAYLAGSPEAQREVDEYREVAALLALGPSSTPALDLRERMLDRLKQPAERPVTPLRRPAPKWGALATALAATLVAVVGLGFGYTQLREVRDLRARLGQATDQVAAISGQMAAVTARLTEREATLQEIFKPGVELFQLTADGDPDPGIQLYWDRERHRAIVNGFRLKPVPAGQAYQLWFIKDGAPVPSVTFKPSESGEVRLERIDVPADGDVSAAAVTVEPESGSAQPTSPILLVGALKRS